MKSILFAALLALSIPSFAVTDNPDGGVTFTKEEGEALLANFKEMEAQISAHEADMQRARAIFREMKKRIEDLDKGKCT